MAGRPYRRRPRSAWTRGDRYRVVRLSHHLCDRVTDARHVPRSPTSHVRSASGWVASTVSSRGISLHWPPVQRALSSGTPAGLFIEWPSWRRYGVLPAALRSLPFSSSLAPRPSVPGRPDAFPDSRLARPPRPSAFPLPRTIAHVVSVPGAVDGRDSVLPGHLSVNATGGDTPVAHRTGVAVRAAPLWVGPVGRG
jgi:hypothetical protein